MENYSLNSNSVYTQRGFAFAIRNNQNEEIKKLLAFILVSAMQTAFLAKKIGTELLGYDLYSKEQRDLFISDTVTMLLHGSDNKEASADEI